jgi:hypothetical protein
MAKRLRLRLPRLTKRQRNTSLVVVLLVVIGVLVWHFTKPSDKGTKPSPSQIAALLNTAPKTTSPQTTLPQTTAPQTPNPLLEGCSRIGIIRGTDLPDPNYFYILDPNGGQQLTEQQVENLLSQRILIVNQNGERIRRLRFNEIASTHVDDENNYSYLLEGSKTVPSDITSGVAYLCN